MTEEELLQLMKEGPLLGSYYHKKSGNIYTLTGVGILEKTLEQVVIYNRNGIVWIRPTTEFNEKFLKAE